MYTEIDRRSQLLYSKEEGRQEERIEIAKTMLSNGYPKEEVSKIIRIPIEELDLLR